MYVRCYFIGEWLLPYLPGEEPDEGAVYAGTVEVTEEELAGWVGAVEGELRTAALKGASRN
jgi:hypothetical protein